jgi:predicted component of type VI protein secretion system
MEESSKPDLTNELHQLGINLKSTLQSAWESEERKKVQEEIERGLADLGKLLQDASTEFEANRVGQEIKAGVADFRTRLQSGEVETRIREDLMQALKAVNAELDKLSEQWAKPDASPPASGPEAGDE